MCKRIVVLPAAIALAAGLLVGAAGTGSAAETQHHAVAGAVSQPAAACHALPNTAPAGSTPLPDGTVGPGWG